MSSEGSDANQRIGVMELRDEPDRFYIFAVDPARYTPEQRVDLADEFSRTFDEAAVIIVASENVTGNVGVEEIDADEVEEVINWGEGDG